MSVTFVHHFTVQSCDSVTVQHLYQCAVLSISPDLSWDGPVKVSPGLVLFVFCWSQVYVSVSEV